jgi:hypothetical protein
VPRQSGFAHYVHTPIQKKFDHIRRNNRYNGLLGGKSKDERYNVDIDNSQLSILRATVASGAAPEKERSKLVVGIG